MKITVQKRLAGEMMNCSPKRVVFDQSSLQMIKEAITKADIRALISSGAIAKKPEVGNSRVRARKTAVQKSKGRQRSVGSRKGRANARESTKTVWINRIRAQRELIKELRDNKKLDVKNYRELYQKVKGGFFRNKRHIKLYIGEKNILMK